MNSKRQVVIFAVFVVGCIFLLSLIFRGGSKKSTDLQQKTVKDNFSLVDYANKNSKVVAIIDGRINGDDAHRAVRISVDQNFRTIDVIQGYQGTVINSKAFTNNQAAYSEFLSALAKTGFGKTRKTSIASESGVCATGRRFVYELFNDDRSVSRTWTAGCQKGSSPANAESVNNLFRRQITDYDKIVGNITL